MGFDTDMIDLVHTILIFYTGVGVDLRVDHAVIFGLPETAENLLQEGGRPMRGSDLETQGKHGFSFFFHKGNLGKFRPFFAYLLLI